MNPEWLGDSYDIVKRFFVRILQELGYCVYVDPMATGDWADFEEPFLRLLGAEHIRHMATGERSALLLDPDTGIGRRNSRQHTTVQAIVDQLKHHEVVFVFDQSFSRGHPRRAQFQQKLDRLAAEGSTGFYYDSHASFLFASHSIEELEKLSQTLVSEGLPEDRLVFPERAVQSNKR